MRLKNRKNDSIKNYLLTLFSVITILFVFASYNQHSVIVASNVNSVKSIESSKIIAPEPEEEIIQYINVFSIDELKNNQGNLVEFTGTITGYGPDCEGCSGILACPPHQNVLENNIYYNDIDYGNLRILAADASIPCGSIIRVSNYDNQEFLGIVLDRGRDIQGLTMDLLFNSEFVTIDHGRKYNINFKIERWGF